MKSLRILAPALIAGFFLSGCVAPSAGLMDGERLEPATFTPTRLLVSERLARELPVAFMEALDVGISDGLKACGVRSGFIHDYAEFPKEPKLIYTEDQIAKIKASQQQVVNVLQPDGILVIKQIDKLVTQLTKWDIHFDFEAGLRRRSEQAVLWHAKLYMTRGSESGDRGMDAAGREMAARLVKELAEKGFLANCQR